MKFGCQLPLETGNFDLLLEIARECERLGYDSVVAYDHLSPFWAKPAKVLECWTVLSAIAQRTRTIKLGSLVTNINLRQPSLLAKMASTVDNISNGRLILGLGTGDRMSRDELLSYGYNFAYLHERIERLRETILILKAMWSEDEASFHGRYYEIRRAVNYPKPKQTPHPPIWIGGRHQGILDIVAEMASGWNYWGPNDEQLLRCSSYLSDKCAKIGRRVEDITKSWAGTISELPRSSSTRPQMLQILTAALRRKVNAGTRYFIADFGTRPDRQNLKMFAEAVSNLEQNRSQGRRSSS